jgi:hypothetical protein
VYSVGVTIPVGILLLGLAAAVAVVVMVRHHHRGEGRRHRRELDDIDREYREAVDAAQDVMRRARRATHHQLIAALICGRFG